MKSLKGTLSNTFGGFLTIRGTAPFSDIVALSSPKEYQRVTLDDHLLEIEEFYEKGEAVFFPEVILSLELKYDFNNIDIGTTALMGDPTNHILKGEKFKSNVDQITITSTKTGIATVSIPDGVIPFGRIDGNHRLSVNGTSSVLTEEVPFCIVVFSSSHIDKNEKTLFFNINSKGRPLTTEETLKAIIDDDESFLDEDLKNNPSFGWPYYLARKVKEQLNYSFIPRLKNAIEPNTRTFLVETFKYLVDKTDVNESESTIAMFNELLGNVNTLFNSTKLLETSSSGLLGAFMYYQIKSPQRVQLFKNWVLKNHIYELTDLDIDGFVKIFDKIAETKRKEIFISMQFSSDTEQNYKAIKDAVDAINEECNEDINIREIRIDQFNTGFSYDINDEILSLIENCGLLIADLTKGNKNVYHELGYLMGLNQGKGISHENFILIHNSAVGDSKEDVGFNLVSIKQLREKDSNSLRQKLKEQIKIYYGL